MSNTRSFPALLEAFFVDRLMRQRQVSPHTIASYRDTFRLLLQYAQRHLGKAPSSLALPDLDTSFLGAFLDHLEQERDNSARSRNVRLAAVHSFFRYVALHAPEHSALTQRVLAMPSKRYVRRPIAFLTSVEVAALLTAPDLNTWGGRRDRALLLLAVQTGLRAAELIGLCCDDIVLGPIRSMPGQRAQGSQYAASQRYHHGAARLLRERQAQPTDPVFPTISGTALSHDGLQYLLTKHLAVARLHCPSLVGKHVTPHVLRHTLAMDLLHHGVDRSLIALWLGHESIETTAIYLQADMQLKEQALAKTTVSDASTRRYRPDDRVLAFLRSL
jgi:site-specific recombinase XerD